MSTFQTVVNDALKSARRNVRVGISFESDNIKITRPGSCNEIMLPTRASSWDDQIMVNVNDIKSIKTKERFDYYLILGMYDGTIIKIKYSFSSNMKRDLNKIMEMRSYRPTQTTTGFYFEF